MRIVIATGVYYPMTNGVATFSHNLATGLARKGHEVLVLCPSFEGKKHIVQEGNLTVQYISAHRMALYPDQIHKVPKKQLFYKKGAWVSFRPYHEIKAILRKFKPDVIHVQTPELIGFSAIYYAKRRKIPLVITGHNYPDTVTGQFKMLKFAKRPLDAIVTRFFIDFQKHGDYTTMPTELAIRNLILDRHQKYNAPIEAISNGIDLKAFRPGKPSVELYKKYRVPSNKPAVIYVGRVDPEKNIAMVLKAFANVVQKVPESILIVVGDGTDLANLKKLAQKLKIAPQVYFLGRVLLPELAEVYKMGKVFATGSEMETQGIVLIEAAATGLPLVAVDKGGVADICQNNFNGFLGEAGNTNEMAQNIIKLLTDAKLYKKFAQNSLKVAQKHDLEATLTRFIEIYQKLMK